MNLFSKIFSFLKRRKFNKEIRNSINKNERILSRLHDDLDYDGMGNYGRFPPITGDEYPTYEERIKEYELENSK